MKNHDFQQNFFCISTREISKNMENENIRKR